MSTLNKIKTVSVDLHLGLCYEDFVVKDHTMLYVCFICDRKETVEDNMITHLRTDHTDEELIEECM